MAGRGRALKRLDQSESVVAGDAAEPKRGTAVQLMAKYTYKANPNRPGGFDEIDIKQGENVWLVKKSHGDNNLWWEIERKDGKCGYAPAQYLMEVESKVTSLPWLNKDPEPDEVPTGNKFGLPKFKPYVSAYEEKQPKTEENYHCSTCERSFNGPIPFRAHMKSKAHREEEEIAKRYGRE